MLLVSCGNSEPKPISAKAIVKEVNQKLVDDAQGELFAEIAVGTYECNDPIAREYLAKLEVAGLIEYDITRYAWWEKSKKAYKKAYKVIRGYGWWSYEDIEYKWVSGTAYDFEDHYVVDVKLTKKGERLAVDARPEPKPQVDEDLVSDEVDYSKYAWNQVDLEEAWEDIPNPFIEKKEPKEPKAAKEKAQSKRKPKEVLKESKNDPTIRIDSLQYKHYMEIDEVKEVKYLRAGEVKAIKARNIQLIEKDGVLTAAAEVIYETEDATDAGRILIGFENGQKSAKDVVFTYYYDKGWVLKELEEK
jgi:hypothetical protein